MELVAADPRLVEDILDSTYHHWNEGLSREAYGRWYHAQLKTAWGRLHLSRYALVDRAELLSSAKLYELTAVLDTRRVRVAGIAAVFTPPEHRGRGLARVLVERLLERIRGDGFDLALLFSEIGDSYYRQFGFEPVPGFEHSFGVFEHERWGAPATLVRAGHDADLGPMADMGRLRASGFRFHLDRDTDLIYYSLAKRRLHAGLGPPGAREVQFFVTEEGSAAVAYLVLSVCGREWVIEDWGDRDPTGARVGAMLQTLIAREPALARPLIRGWVPSSFAPPQLRLTGTRPLPTVMMVRGLTMPTPTLAESDVLYFHADVF